VRGRTPGGVADADVDDDETDAVIPAVLFHLIPPLGSADGMLPYLLRKAFW